LRASASEGDFFDENQKTRIAAMYNFKGRIEAKIARDRRFSTASLSFAVARNAA